VIKATVQLAPAIPKAAPARAIPMTIATLPVITGGKTLSNASFPIRMISNLISPAAAGLGRPDIPFSNALLASVTLPISILIGSRWGLVGVSLAWLIIFPPVFLWYLSLSDLEDQRIDVFIDVKASWRHALCISLL
jgi:hypothetical protein